MLVSGRRAAECLSRHGATACTDVTGFGLAGHLLEMLQASQVDARLKLEAVPVIDGASEASKEGFTSSLYPENQRVDSQMKTSPATRALPSYPLLFDPQTAGGLLASVPSGRAETCLAALREEGFEFAATIGEAKPMEGSESCMSVG